jgi:hypothetical protein
MSAPIEALERTLIEDLERLGDRRAHDEKLMIDLYRALAGTSLSKHGAQGHLILSWARAAEVVDVVRVKHGKTPLEGLEASGGEGEISQRAREALQAIGWDAQPIPHDRADPHHLSRPESPPRRRPEPPEWRREAEREAERERLRRL